MVCLSKRDRQLSLYDLSQGQVRKDFRRPRFSFFRFNCQTAASWWKPETSERLGTKSPRTLSGRTGFALIATDQSLGTPEKSRERSSPRRPRQQRRRRWAVYSSGLVRVSTTDSKKVRKSSFSEDFRAVAAHKTGTFRAAAQKNPHAQLEPRSAGLVRPAVSVRSAGAGGVHLRAPPWYGGSGA